MERLIGTVEKQIFTQEDGYAVLEVRLADRALPIRVVGALASVQVGQQLTVRGEWRRHARFGEQFKVSEFQASVPENPEGIFRYLASGAIAGVGAGLAQRLVDAFGTKLFTLAENDPLVLMQVHGIGKARAKAIASALAENRLTREAMVFLQGLGLGPVLAARIQQAWGDRTIERVRADPYRLVQDIEGVGFATADGLARRLGVAHDAASRMAAGLIHLLREARDAGHTVADKEQLVARAAAFLDADLVAVEAALEGLLIERAAEARELAQVPVVGLKSLVFAEDAIAAELRRLTSAAAALVPREEVDRRSDIALTEEQSEAVRVAATGPVAVITGGPGTGKTTVVRTLVRVLAARKVPVFLCAPTGRAAKRLAEATGRDATTVHRLLGPRLAGGRGMGGQPRDWLEEGAFVVDEASMIDVLLMRRLVESIPAGSNVVLVGDADQLPSVGPGNVLADLIASQALPVARLSTVFRQAEQSLIVRNAHRIRRGELPEPSPVGETGGGDFHIVYVDTPERAQARVVEVCCERIPKAYGLDPFDDVQVLSPMHRGPAGTLALNEALQRRLNPKGPALARPTVALRVGDKVMQTKNDHLREVFNGDVGRILAVNPAEGSLLALINGVEVRYSAEQCRQLAHAYCVSIHKSQGSEYPAVVVPILTQHYMLLQRNLLYTAVTRAKRLVVLVGSQRAIKIAVDREDPSLRLTRLGGLLAR